MDNKKEIDNQHNDINNNQNDYLEPKDSYEIDDIEIPYIPYSDNKTAHVEHKEIFEEDIKERNEEGINEEEPSSLEDIVTMSNHNEGKYSFKGINITEEDRVLDVEDKQNVLDLDLNSDSNLEEFISPNEKINIEQEVSLNQLNSEEPNNNQEIIHQEEPNKRTKKLFIFKRKDQDRYQPVGKPTPNRKNKKINKKFWVMFLILVVLIFLGSMLLPDKNSNEETIISTVINKIKTISFLEPISKYLPDNNVGVVPNQPSNNSNPIPDETIDPNPMPDGNTNPNPIPNEETNQDNVTPTVDPKEQFIIDLEISLFGKDYLNIDDIKINKVYEPNPSDNYIVIEGNSHLKDIYDLNRSVREIQKETADTLINHNLKATQVEIWVEGNKYVWITDKKTIQFINELNFEERHSSQLWWNYTKVYLNGSEYKTTKNLVDLYVPSPHPIWDENMKNLGKTSNEEDNVENKYTYDTFKNEKYLVSFQHPSSLKLKSVENNNTLTVEPENKVITPIGIKLTTSLDKINTDGIEQIFMAKTYEIGKEKPEYMKVKDRVFTNFKGDKIMTRIYKVPPLNVNQKGYYLYYSVSYDTYSKRIYELFVTQDEDNYFNFSFQAEFIITSSYFDIVEENITENNEDNTTENQENNTTKNIDSTVQTNNTSSNNLIFDPTNPNEEDTNFSTGNN